MIKCFRRVILLTPILLLLLFLVSYFTQPRTVDSQVLQNDLKQSLSTDQPLEEKTPEQDLTADTPEESGQTSDLPAIEETAPFSNEEINSLKNFWPLQDNTALGLGEIILMGIDKDIKSSCTYITYEIKTDLDYKSAIEQYGNALFGKVPDDSYYKGTTAGKTDTQIDTTLSVLETNAGTIVNIVFESYEDLSFARNIIDKHFSRSLIYKGLTDDNLIMIGLSYCSDNIMVYKVYEPSSKTSEDAYEWYKEKFSGMADFIDSPQDYPASAYISFAYEKCCVTIDDFLDSDIIKITVKSGYEITAGG